MIKIKPIQNLPILDLVNREVEFKKYLEAQVIPDPPDYLLTVYEKRILHEHSYLRAEKYDSPEHKAELKEIQKVAKNHRKIPRNIQNPNYDILMDYYENIIKSSTLSETIKLIYQLHSFLNSFNLIKKFKWVAILLETNLPHLDPRLFEQEKDFPLYLSYLLTKVRNRMVHDEFNCFLTLTNKLFDDQSSQEALDTLRQSRDDPEIYISIVNQILEAFNQQPNFEINQQQTEPLKKPNQYQNLNQFFEYFYFSYT